MRVQNLRAAENAKVWKSWQKFWQLPLGQELLLAEQQLLQPLLDEVRGYHLLLLGSTPAKSLLGATAIHHQLEWRPCLEVAEQSSCLLADPTALPLPDDSIDLVILHHSLELLAQPHALLKEAVRVTLAKGELVILGFNPWSLLGLTRLLPAWLVSQDIQVLRQASLISLPKLQDWLTFLDLDFAKEQGCFHRPAWRSPRLLARFRNCDQRLDARQLPWAGVYMLRIKKRIGSPMRPLPWKKNTSWLPIQPVSSATRHWIKGKNS